MGSIQLGIKQSVGILGSSPGDLLPKDFEALETSRFTSEGGNNTLPHSFPDFTFRTYAPVAFRCPFLLLPKPDPFTGTFETTLEFLLLNSRHLSAMKVFVSWATLVPVGNTSTSQAMTNSSLRRLARKRLTFFRRSYPVYTRTFNRIHRLSLQSTMACLPIRLVRRK